jgi:hypothetical protein
VFEVDTTLKLFEEYLMIKILLILVVAVPESEETEGLYVEFSMIIFDIRLTVIDDEEVTVNVLSLISDR